MTRRQSIRLRLLTDQVLVILLLGGAILATTFFGARRAVEALSGATIRQAAERAESELRRFFDPVTAVLLALRSWGEAGLLADDAPRRLADLATPVAERLPQVSGILVADDRGREHFLLRGVNGWRSRETRVEEWGGRSRWLDWRGEEAEPEERWEELGYDPRTRLWFAGALAARGASESAAPIYWTEPYVLFTARRLGLTASVAWDSGDGRDRVAAIDVPLDDLGRFSRDLEVSENGSLWILTEDRRLLAGPDDPDLWLGADPEAALLRDPRQLGLPLVDDAARAAEAVPAAERDRPVRFRSGGADWWGLVRRFELSEEQSLRIAVLVPHADLLGDRARLRWWILGVTLAVLLGALARAAVLARRFGRPIEDLVQESDRISQGDLEPGKPIVTRLAEIRRLAEAQERMRLGLQTLMKLERDLQLARQIQQNTLPRELPRVAGFDLVGWSEPADETGGDSYDVVGLAADGTITEDDAERTVLMLADATGHGIGPALSVTQLRAMLRMAVRTGSDLPEIAAHVNEQLYADLPGNRFITAWLGDLRVGEGAIATFSAGQAPLLYYHAAADEMEVMNADAPPFGLFPQLPIVAPPPIAMRPGDVYAVFSDGLFEAADAAGIEFGKERLIELIRRHRRAGVTAILAAVRAAVEEFTGGAPADDDRTALVIKRRE